MCFTFFGILCQNKTSAIIVKTKSMNIIAAKAIIAFLILCLAMSILRNPLPAKFLASVSSKN